MSGMKSRRKGIGWEREVAHKLADVFGAEHVRRGLQYRDGADAPDVIAPAIWVECKRGKRTNPRAALAQAIEASAGKGVWPLAVCKDDQEQPFAVMTLEDLCDLLREWWARRSA